MDNRKTMSPPKQNPRNEKALKKYLEDMSRAQLEEYAMKYLGKSLGEYLDNNEEVCICCVQKEKSQFPTIKIPEEGTEYKQQFLNGLSDHEYAKLSSQFNQPDDPTNIPVEK